MGVVLGGGWDGRFPVKAQFPLPVHHMTGRHRPHRTGVFGPVRLTSLDAFASTPADIPPQPDAEPAENADTKVGGGEGAQDEVGTAELRECWR